MSASAQIALVVAAPRPSRSSTRWAAATSSARRSPTGTLVMTTMLRWTDPPGQVSRSTDLVVLLGRLTNLTGGRA